MKLVKSISSIGIVALALVACSKGPPAQSIGPAGGTVTAQDGARVVVPPGALTSQVPIAITLTGSGAPALPADHDSAGPVYALTPHGITFLKPVTVQVPHDPGPSTAALPPGSTGARLLKTNAQGEWFELSASVVDGADGQMLGAEVTTFSFLTTTTSRRQPNPDGLYRSYYMFAVPYGGNGVELVAGPPESPPVGELKVHHQFGEAEFFDDGQADAEIYSNASGSTYWVYAEAPGNDGPEYYAGNEVHYVQAQSFRKEAGDATLEFTVTAVRLQGGHYGGLDILPYECIGSPVCDLKLFARVSFSALAWTTGSDRRVLLRTRDHAVLRSDAVQVSPGQPVWFVSTGNSGTNPLWSLTAGDFTYSDADREGYIHLARPMAVSIDLSDVPVGAHVSLDMHVVVETLNQVQGETYISGFFRDPIEIEGATIEFSGLTPLADLQEPIEEEEAPECTTAIDPAAGTIQFESAGLDMLELPVGVEFAIVTREGGAEGDVSVRVTSHDGSATAGDDFLGVDQVIFFPDGDDSPRWIEVPLIVDDVQEPTEDLTLRLSDPRGCVGLGAPAVATVAIYDNDTPRDPTADLYSVGGTVTGLEGSGLVLTGVGYADLTIADDGPFVFAQNLSSGSLYDVAVKQQPTNPSQSCSVVNGSGQVEDADVTNVLVTCGPPLEVSPYLDAGFGVAGKLTGPLGLGDDVVDVLVQPDGKILVLDEGKLSRFTASGAVDNGFGNGGSVPVAFLGTGYDVAHALALQADGKIVVVGDTQHSVTHENGNDWAAARFNANGSPDTSFGGAGTGVIVGDLGSTPGVPYHESAGAVAIQPDGKIVLGGGLNRFNLGSDFLTIRLTSAGVLDSTFGSGGVAPGVDIGGNADMGRHLWLQSDGKIVIGGRVAPSGGSDPDIGMLRYETDGDLDTTFGDQGVLRDLTDEWDEPFDMLMLSDDSIVTVGSLNRLPAQGGPTGLVARYTSAGAPDSGFGSGGRATVDELQTIRGVARQADGKYLIAGWAVPIGAGDYDFVLMRLQADGEVDTTFGDAGMVAVDFFAGIDSASAVAVQPDGKILVTGNIKNGTTSEMGLMRVMP